MTGRPPMGSAGVAAWIVGVVAAGVAAGVAAQVDELPLPERWQNWRYSRPITLPAQMSVPPSGGSEARRSESGGAGPRVLVRAAVPRGVFARASAELADLRLIDASGDEQAAFVHARKPVRRREWRAVRIVESSRIPAAAAPPAGAPDMGAEGADILQVVADLGEDPPLHNLAELDLEEKDYFARVQVAVGDTPTEWRVVRDGAPVFRFAAEGLDGNPSVSYGNNRARYLRLRIRAETGTPTLRRLQVAEERVETGEREGLTEAFPRDEEAPEGRSRWVVDLEADLPISEVRFKVDQPAFHRPVRVELSRDGRRWLRAGSGQIYRYPAPEPDAEVPTGDAAGRESLAVGFEEIAARWWRVTVFDRDDAPLDGVRPELRGTPRWVVFRAVPGTEYRLLYGNPRAEAADYDLPRLVDRDDVGAAPIARLGAEAVNPGWVDPAPWSERNSWVLWLALAIAVLVIGGMAVRALTEASHST